jgi:hypothetical protein
MKKPNERQTMQFLISPSRLRTLRKQDKLTVTGLYKRLKKYKRPVSTKTISKIEADKNETRIVRQNILSNLAYGLRVNPKVLSGEEPLPAKHAPSDRVKLQIDAVTRLNYDLIERRYDVSIEDIVNIAPVLFIKAAQESLAKQKRTLEEEVLEVTNKVGRMLGEPEPQSLDTVEQAIIDVVDDEECCFSSRMEAIRNNDLFDASVPYDESGGYDPFYEHNPFAYYIQELCASDIGRNMADIDDDPHLSVFSFFSGSGIPINRVCNEDLDKITLGSVEAGQALSSGAVRIKDIPEEYWEPRQAGNRVAWLEDEYAAAQKQKEFDDDEGD